MLNVLWIWLVVRRCSTIVECQSRRQYQGNSRNLRLIATLKHLRKIRGTAASAAAGFRTIQIAAQTRH